MLLRIFIFIFLLTKQCGTFAFASCVAQIRIVIAAAEIGNLQATNLNRFMRDDLGKLNPDPEISAASFPKLRPKRVLKWLRVVSLDKLFVNRFQQGYLATAAFLNSKETVFGKIQVLEQRVLLQAIADGVLTKNDLSDPMKLAAKAKDLEAIMLKKMAELETQFGFAKAIDLLPKIYSPKDWAAMLSRGALFNDPRFNDTDRKGGPGMLHSFYSHRIQWYALMLYYAENVDKFKDADGNVVPLVEYFKEMGNVETAKLFKWDTLPPIDGFNPLPPGYGGSHLWFPLFDSFTSTFTSPEFTRRTHEFLPGLRGWY